MEYLLKASVVVALFYLCFSLLLKKETFFQHNRLFLLIGLIIALIFPLIVIPIYIPIEPSVIQETGFTQHIASDFVNTSATDASFNWLTLLPILYGIGFAVFSIQFILQFGSLTLLLLKNPKYKDEQFTYVIIENKISPFSFFKWIVYNPESYKDEELQLILTHEKVHVNQLHSIDILVTQLACIVFWFNPLIWLYRKEVRQNLEYIADYNTQSKTDKTKEYQHLLLKTSVAINDISLSNNFYNSSIKKRIIMLNKSRSTLKKQWRYVLILPLLCGLLMSMNTEKIYIEGKASSLNSEKTIEFVVTKNTTDSELKSMSKQVEAKGGSLVFSEINRNSYHELISVIVKFYNRSYGGGHSKSTLDSFIIYRELYGDKGGYVGRINGATLHFDKIKGKIENNAQIEALYKRAHKAIVNAGFQTEEDRVKFEKMRSNHKTSEIEEKKESPKPVKTVSVNKPNRNTAQTLPKKMSKNSKIKEDISITLITKHTTDSELDNIKSNLKKIGITAKFKGIKRNKNGEITAIKIEAKSKKSNASYSINSDEAIASIKIVFDEETNSISIGNIKEEHRDHTMTYKTNDTKHKTHTTGSESHVYVTSKTEHHQDSNHKHDEAHKNVEAHSNNEEHKHSTTYIMNDDGEEEIINITSRDGKEPLFIIDGKEIIKSEMKDFKPDMIKSINVLKDKKAIKKYGNKGKHGVIEITTKKKK